MNDVRECLDFLGLSVTDKVTKLEGVVTSISFDLYGCVQALVVPAVQKDGKLGDSYWFDLSRLSIGSISRMMPMPNFVMDKGPENKPTMR